MLDEVVKSRFPIDVGNQENVVHRMSSNVSKRESKRLYWGFLKELSMRREHHISEEDKVPTKSLNDFCSPPRRVDIRAAALGVIRYDCGDHTKVLFGKSFLRYSAMADKP